MIQCANISDNTDILWNISSFDKKYCYKERLPLLYETTILYLYNVFIVSGSAYFGLRQNVAKI